MPQNFFNTNNKAALFAVSSVDGLTPVYLWADPVTHALAFSASVSIAKDPIPASALTSALSVQIVDGSGNQITSFGGGTQYTDGGAPPTHPIGPTIQWSDGTNWQTVSTAKPLPVTASISTAGLATSVKQSDGSQKTQIVDGSGNVIAATSNALNAFLTNSSLAVTGTFFQTTQPVSGTVTANAGTGNFTVVNGGTFAVQATLGAETTKVIGVVRNADGSGNLLTSTGNALDINIKSGSISNTSFAATQATASSLNATVVGTGTFATQVTSLPALAAGTNVIGHVITDTGSTTAVAGNVTVTQATGTNLHTVIDSGTITAVTAITNALPTGANVIGKVGIDQTTPGTTNAVSANQGTAAALASGWPVLNGEASDTTGTFTNATQTTSITAGSLDGYGNVLISINGTFGTATAVFEGSDDGGTTWYGISEADRTDSNIIESGYTSLTNTSRAWQISNPGWDSVRVRSTAVASGTVNVRISPSAAPTSAGASVSIGVALPTGGNTIGAVTGTGTFQVQTSADVPGTGATNLGKAEDAVHTSGDTGVMSLGVANEALINISGTDGDYTPLATDRNGTVHVAQKASTATLSNVAGSATSVTLLSANAARIGAQITNDSTAVIYIKFGATASTTSYTVSLAGASSAPFSYYEVPAGYTGRIDAIWSAGAGNARITEITP